MRQKILSILALAAMTLLPQGAWAQYTEYPQTKTLAYFALQTYYSAETSHTVINGSAQKGGSFSANFYGYGDVRGWRIDETSYLKISLSNDEYIQEGDIITINFYNYNSLSAANSFKLYDDADKTTELAATGFANSNTQKDNVQSYTFTAADATKIAALTNKSEFYIFANTTQVYVKSVQIFRSLPTDVTTESVSAVSEYTKWDFTEYFVSPGALTYPQIYNSNNLYLHTGTSVDRNADGYYDVINLNGTSEKYILFKLAAGKGRIFVEYYPNTSNNYSASNGKKAVLKIGALAEEGFDYGSSGKALNTFTTTYDVASETSVKIYNKSSNGYYIKSITIAPNQTVTLDTYGYATFASPYPLDLTAMTASTGEVGAYKAGVSGTRVNFSTLSQTILANTGILLKGTGGATITIPAAATGTAVDGNDFLVNEAGTTFAGEDGYTYFGMRKNQATLTFAPFTPSTVAIPANKAYLKVLTSSLSSSHELTFVFDEENNGDVTGVNEVRGQKSEVRGEYYNLAGQRVAQPTKGLYIVNGKKVIIK